MPSHVKFVLSRLAILLTCLIVIPAHAVDCEGPLAGPLSIPKEFRLSPEAVKTLSQNPDHALLLESISRVFVVLGEQTPKLSLVAAALREEPTPDEIQSEGLASLPTDVNAAFVILKRSSLAPYLSHSDLVLLAQLFREIPRKQENTILELDRMSRADGLRIQNQTMERIQKLIADRHHRETIRNLFLFPRMRELTLKIALNQREGALIGANTPDYLDRVTKRIGDGKVHRNELFFIHLCFRFIAVESLYYGKNYIPDRLRYERSTFFESAQTHFADKLRAVADLDEMLVMMDHIMFATRLPKSATQLHGIAIEAAKRMLLPRKKELAERPHVIAPEPKAKVEPMQLRLVDHFAPKSSAHIRQDHATLPSASTFDPLSPSIGSAQDLRAFTAFADHPRPIETLVPNDTYEFWFLRERRPIKQSIRFSEMSLAWMNQHPIEARAILNALHMGPARMSGQSGIKRLAKRSNRYDGPLFEIKTAGPGRGLMVFKDSVWQLLDVVHKNSLDRAVEQAIALP